MSDALDRARSAFDRCAWTEAYELLSEADAEEPLALEDLELLALTAQMLGRVAESDDAWAQGFQAAAREGRNAWAAKCALHLGTELLMRGETARSGGWLARADGLLVDASPDCAERGWLQLSSAFQLIFAGELPGAHAGFRKAADIGHACGDVDLKAMAGQGCGRALIMMGDVAAGVALLDEAMVAVTTGEISQWMVGEIYCSVIEACHEIFDLRRAQEWTAIFTRWCAEQPDLVPYRGQCRVHRAQIMQLHGEWPDALDEARQACDWLSRPPPHPAVGLAHYQRGEVHRLRGELDEAEAAYREAHQSGREPQPGLALLRLAQDQVAAAHAAIRRVVDEASDPLIRAQMLGAYVEIALAAGELSAAHEAADEMLNVAAELGAPFLSAQAAHARGAVLLAEGNPRAALGALRHALALAQELNAPYEAARARVVVAEACSQLGDEDSAGLELDSARAVFERLGAATELVQLERLGGAEGAARAGGLTRREAQVLALVAKGNTNRSIAAELVISEKTVARHVSNIFTKLGVTSRSAATSHAYEHGLV